MSTDDRGPRGRHIRPWRRWRAAAAWIAVVLVTMAAVLAAAVLGGGQPDVGFGEERDGHNPGAVPTLPGGIDLGSLEPGAVLVGAGLSFGAPLPSEQAAAEAFTADPEVSSVAARRVYDASDGRHLADVVVLVLDGAELFDYALLRAFMEAAVSVVGGGPTARVPLAGRDVLRAAASDGARVAIGFREANLLSIVAGPVAADVELTVSRQVAARIRGESGGTEPVTPLMALPVDAAFVGVPTVRFAAIPPPEEEQGPVVPSLAGATAVAGRYGVVAGERRTVVWSFAVDPGSYPSAEALEPSMRALAAGRTGNAAPSVVEVGDRIVFSAIGEAGSPSAQVFRHQGLVLLVEGDRPDQVDAVATAWIAALGSG